MLTYEELVSEVKKRPLKEQVSLLQELAIIVNQKINSPEFENQSKAPARDIPTAEKFWAMFSSPIKGKVPMTKKETRKQWVKHLEKKYK